MRSFYQKIDLNNLLDRYVDLGMLKTGLGINYDMDLYDFIYIHNKIVTTYNKLANKSG